MGSENGLEPPPHTRLVEPFAQHVGQRAVVGLRDVGYLELRGVGLGSGAHRADKRHAPFECREDERQFGREGVDGVDDIVVFRGIEQRVGFVVLDVAFDRRKPEFRVDVAEPFGHHGGLGTPHGRVQRYQLAVDVGCRHRVGIGYGHAPHACPGDHLGGVGSHAADSHDQYVGTAQHVEFLFAQQQGGAFQPVIHE